MISALCAVAWFAIGAFIFANWLMEKGLGKPVLWRWLVGIFLVLAGPLPLVPVLIWGGVVLMIPNKFAPRKTLSLLLAGALLLVCSGCATKLTNLHYAANDPAVKVVGMDGGGVGLGLDLLRWREVSEHPFAHLAAAGADFTSLAAVFKLVKDYLAKHKIAGGGDSADPAAPAAPTITINGNNNTINYKK